MMITGRYFMWNVVILLKSWQQNVLNLSYPKVAITNGFAYILIKSKRQVFVNSAFNCLLLCNVHQFCSSNVWVLQHHPMHAFDMSTILVFVYLGLQFKWYPFSSNNSRHTSCIHKGLHAGKWPDLLTPKPDVVSTLGYHWTVCTGTTRADAITQWPSSGNPVVICIIGIHWKITGATSTLGCHWNHTGWC